MITADRPIFLHSDSTKGFIAAKKLGAKIDPQHIAKSLYEFLCGLTPNQSQSLIFPAFNYDYGKTRHFNVDHDAVQVGVLPEWVRNNTNFNRTEVPFFSFLSQIDLDLKVDQDICVDPFGKNSAFHKLLEMDANIHLFGAPISSLTIIHYVEQVTGPPKYRYEKDFPGKIISGQSEKLCSFSMHVRPLGANLNYDFSRLESDLINAPILRKAAKTAYFS